MRITIKSTASTLVLALAASAFVAVAAEPKVAERPKPEPPKITHENLFQMEQLVEQGADPNAPYWLFGGHT